MRSRGGELCGKYGWNLRWKICGLEYFGKGIGQIFGYVLSQCFQFTFGTRRWVMDKEQNRKFEEWYKRADSFHGLHDKVICEIAWQACLDANKIEENEPEPPTPTEMVRKLLEKGWEVEQGTTESSIFFRQPSGEGWMSHSLQYAYREAFPPKKKVEVEVWLDSDGEVRIIPSNSDSKGLDPKRVSWGWTKVVATFFYLGGGITMFGGWFILTASISIAVIAFYFLLVLGSEEKTDERNKNIIKNLSREMELTFKTGERVS